MGIILNFPGKVIPFPATPQAHLRTARDLAERNLIRLYTRAMTGDNSARAKIIVLARSEGEPEIARLAQMAADNFGVVPPCDSGDVV